jgi:alanine racemase
LIYGLSWSEIAEGLRSLDPLPGRTRLLPGLHGSHLLDDSYNASPDSALAALETLQALSAELGCRRRLLVLGDMEQLGDSAPEAHARLGERCAALCDGLYVKGELAHQAAQGALDAGMAPDTVHRAYSDKDIIRLLRDEIGRGDLVLFKGSAGARLERIVEQLLRVPERDRPSLPRQHRGWQQVRLQRPGRPTWVEIDLQAIARNARRVAEHVGPKVDVLAVLKADGYGHGAVKVAHTALNNGVSWLGVACLGEAITLRENGIDAPILILGYTPPWQARDVLLHDVTSTVFSSTVARALSRAATDLDRPARVHIKVDTGMGRLGLLPDQVLPFVQEIAGLPGLEIEGIFTHMSAADDADLDYTRWQLERFDRVLTQLDAHGCLPPRVHAANSACLLRIPASHYSMVRLGIALYGLDPSEDAPLPPGFCPALSFKCQIAQVRELSQGSYISYGRTYCTPRPSRIAVIPVGYADGFRRAPQNWAEVLVQGQRAPIVGRVCMDQTMIDVTDISGVRQGDEVVLIGRQGDECISVDDVARRLGTINYEVVSELLARVPRMV